MFLTDWQVMIWTAGQIASLAVLLVVTKDYAKAPALVAKLPSLS